MTQLPPVPERTMNKAFEKALEQVPEKSAFLEQDGREWTYSETHDRALQVGEGLRRLGIEPQEPVAIMLDNSYDFLSLVFGLGLTRRVQVPVNTAYKGSFLTHVLNDSGARVLVIEDHYVERLRSVSADLLSLKTVVARGGNSAVPTDEGFQYVEFDDLFSEGTGPAEDADPADLMAIMYTSGTTGVSKGVEITHVHAYTYASREDTDRPSSADRILVTLPMFHLAGQWYGAYQSLIARATAVIQPTFSVSKFWDWVRDFDISHTVMLGAMAELLQQAEPQLNDSDNPLTLAVMAPLASDMQGFRERFGVEIGAVYGMSEIGAVMFADPPTVVEGEAGMARDGYELRLVDSQGRDVPHDVPGELLVKPDSPLQVMQAYHGRPEKTAETLKHGWVHTGDIFRRDHAGHYYFVDRKKDALRRRGENVSSFEVEKIINEFPDVYESAVVGVPSEFGEDEIKAVIVPRADKELSPPSLTEFIAERLPYFMVPRYIQVVDELPKTPTLKVQKHELRTAIDNSVWDRQAAGVYVNKNGLTRSRL